jgi:aspartate/glutamate racemase
MRQITIKDWLYLQNANELETISRVLDISIDALNKKSVEDFLICRNETNNVLTELKEVSPSN